MSNYSYSLPEELIAQYPVAQRDSSRMMHLDRKNGRTSHHSFREIELMLRDGDLVVVNNTKVIPARLKGVKQSGGKVEVLLLDYAGGVRMQEEKGIFQCECMIRASKSPKAGTFLFLYSNVENAIGSGDGCIRARVEENLGAVFMVSFFCKGDFTEELAKYGQIPLPPYIRRDGQKRELQERDRLNYQTVYASKEGAVAAPTAGLHFTDGLIGRLKKRGIRFAEITLHVGYGTFSPVRVKDIREHQIHSEFFSISEECARAINSAKKEGRRVIAVGTTSVRTLEYAALQAETLQHSLDDHCYQSDASERKSLLTDAVKSGSGTCDLFIYPGYQFRVVDAMVTNFHLPESTLLMLVSAFCDRKMILGAYQEAVEKKYRFFSYGDAMFIE
ncbi:tRNA preQ1(34) S-adenosylmethionine ribosyltransferase-isomerase QueA [Desulfamplus magnetovallimortis]|uniref:tRNA preQ1(34) S-adenosylmethionine ribosyltransferase-isomerase QueA n=1 Tax=Desulfamplus magnetovallimortis TaxID=1246637 RepID=UPI003183B01B